jgi:hypothetical protein
MEIGSKTYRMVCGRGPTTHKLAAAAEPLSLRYEWHTIAFLVNSQVTPVTENDGIGVFAVAIIANYTLGVLLFSCASRLAIDRSC